MEAIVNVTPDWGIGFENRLLVAIPEDLKRFRALTEGKTVILGRKTLQTFPGGKPLKNRRNLVLSSDFSFFLWEPHPASIPANRVRHNNNTITLYLFITPPAVKTEGQRFSFWVLSFLIHLLQQSLPRKKSSVPQLPLFPFCPLSDMCHLLKACALLMCH